MTPGMREPLSEGGDLVDVIVEAGEWDETGLGLLADRAARAALAEVGLTQAGVQIALLATDDARIAALNAGFRGKPQPTNVLSWPSADRAPARPGALPDLPEAGDPSDPAELGDIALAYETCVREAALAEKSLDDHVAHLIVHAVLHLLGYDHLEDADATLMEATEVRALARMGLADPY
jgi:probable rRNA maturation factor